MTTFHAIVCILGAASLTRIIAHVMNHIETPWH